MTGYYIEVGYNSKWDKEEVWKELKKVVIDICKNSKVLIEEIKRETNKVIPIDFIEKYKWPCKDLTIRITENNEDNKENFISQAASGGGYERDCKEICRRAFCRLILLEMHKREMEVNIFVS